MTKKALFVLYPNVQLLDVSGPAAVLEMVNTVLGKQAYELQYVSASESGTVITNNRMSVNTGPLPEVESEIGSGGKNKVECIDMLIMPGALDEAIEQALQDKKLISWLHSVSDKVVEKISVCSGAFFFAELGWLENKKATTHWAAAKRLSKEHPNVRVISDSLYQNDGNIWSSGGVTSGIDMMLAVITKDYGVEVAIKTAKLLVVYLLRDGNQSQFSIPIEYQSQSNDHNMISLIAWLETRLDQVTTATDMAQYANISVRKLHQICKDMFDLGPAQLLAEMRMEKARTLLQQETTIKEIAFACGFSQTAAFTKAFNRRYGISPSKYRDAYTPAAS